MVTRTVRLWTSASTAQGRERRRRVFTDSLLPAERDSEQAARCSAHPLKPCLCITPSKPLPFGLPCTETCVAPTNKEASNTCPKRKSRIGLAASVRVSVARSWPKPELQEPTRWTCPITERLWKRRVLSGCSLQHAALAKQTQKTLSLSL